MKPNIEHSICGIYCIENLLDGKVYIGASKNIYRRIHQHLYSIKNRKLRSVNLYLLDACNKYGIENFKYYIIETLPTNDELLKERELYWMGKYNSLNRDKGYNIRSDSKNGMVTHNETSEKISKNLKRQWELGIRDKHSKKLSINWKKNPKRKIQQSKLLSKTLTKYVYNIYNLHGKFIEQCKYKRLKELGITNALNSCYKLKSNKVKCKGYFVERVKIKNV